MPAPKKTSESARMGVNLRALRLDVGLTQRQVAERFGLELEAYRQREKGYVSFKTAEMPGLARALGVPLRVLGDRLELAEPLTPEEPFNRRRLDRVSPRLAAVLGALDRRAVRLGPERLATIATVIEALMAEPARRTRRHASDSAQAG